MQQATKVEMFINLKTARALGITIPLPLSGRADEIFLVMLFLAVHQSAIWHERELPTHSTKIG